MGTRNTLLIADDMSSNRNFLHKLFEEDYDLMEAADGAEAMELITEHRDDIAAVLLDLVMPVKDGYQVLAEMGEKGYLDDIPVIVVTSDSAKKSEARSLELGALDLVSKPYDPYIIRKRVNNLVALKKNRRILSRQLGEMTEAMSITNDSIVNTLATITEFRSLESGQHILRIRKFTEILLKEVAHSFPEYELDEQKIATISSAAVLHDIGKISIPDSILNKPGKLTKEEFDEMKTHTTAGCEILDGMTQVVDREYMRYAYNICRYHHERWDGRGYPDGLQGNNIPICAQVVAIADVYDALTTKRVYKGAVSHEESANMILNGECGVFNPNILECFKQVLPEFSACANSYADQEISMADDIHVPLPLPKNIDTDLSTQQMSTVKYHALLNHVGGIVIEVDMNSGAYHLVYDEYDVFSGVSLNGSFDEVVVEITKRFAHEHDRNEVLRFYDYLREDFFKEGLRRCAKRFQMLSKSAMEYMAFECSFIRIDTGNPNQRKGIITWKRLGKGEDGSSLSVNMDVVTDKTLRGMMGSVLKCRNDRAQTMIDGEEQLADFLSYEAEEFREAFDGKYLNVIMQEDREMVLTHAYKQLDYGSIAELEYRLIGSDGRTVWIRDRASVIFRDGLEYTYHVLIDITMVRQSMDRLRSMQERHDILLSQIEEITFEWDVANDTVSLSPNFKYQLGYDPDPSQITQGILDGTSKIHPDDLKSLQAQINNVRNNHEYPSFIGADFRIKDSNDTYVWRRLRANTQQMENGKIECIIGTLIDINEDKHSLIKQSDEGEQDTLTKLYNFNTAKNLISEYLSSRRVGERAALLIIDLDHFQEINLRYGRMAGDALLLQCTKLLSALFYSGDILARIGGDEFMVLAKNISTQTLLESHCQHIVDEVSLEIARSMPECRTSCSIGASLIPEDGETFGDLFQRAEQALYNAKHAGRGQYAFYQQGDRILPGNTIAGSHIESDEFPGLADKSLIYYTFNRLYESGDVEATISSLMEIVGRQMNVSRVYIFENSDDNLTTSNTFEWCNEGIEPQITERQNVSFETDVPGWESHYNEQGIFLCENVAELPKIYRDALEPQGIKSMLQCSIIDHGVFRGFIGLDECTVERTWTREQVDVLTMAAKLTSVFLMKKRAIDSTEKWTKSLVHVLENSTSWVYVVEVATGKVLFSNNTVREAVPQMVPGAYCYEAMMNRDRRCDYCVAFDIKNKKFNRQVKKNEHLEVVMSTESHLITWDGAEAALVICRV